MAGDGGEAKRTRRACDNCRRKKTRCPGERPACGFCVRLDQPCSYSSVPTTTATHQKTLSIPTSVDVSQAMECRLSPQVSHDTMLQMTQSFVPPAVRPASLHLSLGLAETSFQPDLTARVAQLEARLSTQLGGGISRSPDQHEISQRRESFLKRKLSAVSPSHPPQHQHADSNNTDMQETFHDHEARFSVPPPLSVLKKLIDVYFANCQNQPYCFFHESTMRKRLLDGDVPRYLVLAFAATATRYSMHPFFEDKQIFAVEAYAKASWAILLERVFAGDDCIDITVAQATVLLAIIEYTAGKSRLAWVKFGLATRLIQDLKLNAEPNDDLPTSQKEEHRRTFWSIYALDKIMACTGGRPVAVADNDCTVALPYGDESFREDAPPTGVSTLAKLREPAGSSLNIPPDSFTMLILMSSLLGRIVRSVFQESKLDIPCWDHRSDFARSGSVLLNFESIHAVGDDDLQTHICNQFSTYEGFDRQQAGHFVWARAIYHLCGTMLYHPVNLYKQRQAYQQRFPKTFARELANRFQNHVSQLTEILRVVQVTRCCARGSFLGYMAANIASIHKLFLHSTDESISAKSRAALETCIAFLEQTPLCWPNYTYMAAAVRNFDIEQSLARRFIDPSLSPTIDVESHQLDHLRRMIDYAWISDPRRAQPLESEQASGNDFGTSFGWTPFSFDVDNAIFAPPGDDPMGDFLLDFQ